MEFIGMSHNTWEKLKHFMDAICRFVLNDAGAQYTHTFPS